MAALRFLYFLIIALLTASAVAVAQTARPALVGDSDKDVSAQEAPPQLLDPAVPLNHYILVEPWTAYVLSGGEWKLGLMNIDYGIGAGNMFGTDFLADAIGAPNIKSKTHIISLGRHDFALGLRAAYFGRDTILWGSVKDEYEELEARIFSPSISYSTKLSERLNVHSYWGMGVGKVRAKLSDEGKRKYWQRKHPGEDYDSRDKEATSGNKGDKTASGTTEGSSESRHSNQERKNEDREQPTDATQRTLLASSLTGMLSDIFQVSGEYTRVGGNKILLTSRVERFVIEELKATTFRFTAAQQWIWPHFQFRFGLGMQYVIISGTDLDDEKIEQEGFLPASDIDFYWRF